MTTVAARWRALPPAQRRFVAWLTVIALVGLAVRLAYVLVERRTHPVAGDAIFYHDGANLLADGRGFISPYFLPEGRVVEAAEHPPLYTVFLAAPSVLGLTSPLTHMIWTCVLGTGTVVVAGLLGRTVAGATAGLLAAAFTAIYPNVFSWDGFLTSETLATFLVTLTLLLVYRYRRDPTLAGAVGLGVAVALAALTRAELVLLIPLVVVPVIIGRREVDRRDRWRALVASGLAAVVIVAPWIGYNLTRFQNPVFLSSGFDVTLSSANCDETYFGPYIGYWTSNCPLAVREMELGPEFDQSEEGPVFRRAALDYVGDHVGRVPFVVLTRWGRTVMLYHPTQIVALEQFPEGRERWLAWSGLFSFYAVAGLAVLGVVVLRRRRVPVYPLVAPMIIVWVAVTLAFGTSRYRAVAETALTVLAAVAIDAMIRRVRRRRAPVTVAAPP